MEGNNVDQERSEIDVELAELEDSLAPKLDSVPLVSPNGAGDSTAPLPGKRRRKKKSVEVTEPLEVTAPSPPTDLIPIIIPLVKLPFEVVAGRTGCVGVRLTDAEAALLAQACDATVTAYTPLLSPRHAALGVLAASIAGLTLAKRQILDDHRAKTVTPNAPT